MSGGERDAAVRVEIDVEELPPSFLPGAQRRVSTGRPTGGGPPRGVIAVAVLIAAMSIAAIFVLRPDPGQTAAGTQRLSPTTTTDVASSTLGPALDVDGAPLETAPVARVQIAEGFADIEAVIPWTSGFIGLGSGIGEQLRIYSSADGTVWSRLPTLVVDLEPLDGRDLGSRVFAALGQADERTLVVTMVESVQGSNGERFAFATRLRSNDGLLWSPDPDFEPMALGSVTAALALVNTPELMVVGAYRGVTGNPLIEKVVAEYVTDAEIASRCWLDAWSAAEISSEAVVLLQDCDTALPIVLRPDQLVDPSLAAEVGQCLTQLSGRSGAPLDIFMERSGNPSIRIYTAQGSVSALPVPTPDGKIAVLEPGGSLDGAPACAQFDVFEAIAPTNPGVSLLEPREGTERLSSLGSLPQTQIFGLPQSIAVTDTEILVPTAFALYAADRQTSTWVERAVPINRAGTVWMAPNGRQLFTFAEGAMFIADSSDGDWQRVELDMVVRPDRILYADDERAVFGRAEDLVVVTLPIR